MSGVALQKETNYKQRTMLDILEYIITDITITPQSSITLIDEKSDVIFTGMLKDMPLLDALRCLHRGIQKVYMHSGYLVIKLDWL